MEEIQDLNQIKFWDHVLKTWSGVVADFKPDAWQQDILDHQGSIVIRSGRQVGKSEITSRKASAFLLTHPNTQSLIIAASQRQASMLFLKLKGLLATLDYLLLKSAKKDNPEEWRKAQYSRDKTRDFEKKYSIFEERPSQTHIVLKNKAEIWSLPAGRTGDYIRGFSLDLLIIDEAAFIPDRVWTALKPMIAVSRKRSGLGWVIMLSTPFGKGGFFYEACHDKDFKQWHIPCSKCSRIPTDFLQKEQRRLSKLEYAQEYEGEFIDEFNQLFPTSLIVKRSTLLSWDAERIFSRSYYLGIDVARYGQDASAFVIAEVWRPKGNPKDHIRILHCDEYTQKGLIDLSVKIESLDKKYNFSNILIDDHGVGGGITDYLIDKFGKRKITALNNARKTIDKYGRKGKLFKEDLYSHAIALMESEPCRIEIVNNLKLQRSLKSVTFEYTADRNLKIWGKNDHLAEAFVRACWSLKTKNLKLFLA